MHAPPLTPDARSYRDQNRTVTMVLLLAGAWQLSAYLVAVKLGHPLYECPSRVWLHIPCPLCGLTRGSVALLRGDLARALSWNPLTPVAMAGFAMEILFRALGSTNRVATSLLRWRRTDLLTHIALGILFLVYALAFHLWRATHF